MQAGVSPQGRDFAAANSDLIFSPYSRLPEARDFYLDIKSRARAHGRNPDHLKIIPGAGFVLGDSLADAEEKARYLLEQQLTDRTVQVLLRAASGTSTSPRTTSTARCPTSIRIPRPRPIIQGRAFIHQDRFEMVRAWRELAEAKGLSIRGLAAEISPRARLHRHPGSRSPRALDDFIQNDGADGVVLGGHFTPGGLDEFVDKVVPLLQERGSLRTEYTGVDAAREPRPADSRASRRARGDGRERRDDE